MNGRIKVPSEQQIMTEGTRRNCFKCRFFYVTWEPEHPNGCRAMGFKTKQLPSTVVYQTSGEPCSYFSPKEKKES